MAMTESIPHYPTDSAAYPPPVKSNIGICGAHRTGKTTLAKALADRLAMPFVDIATSKIFAQHGLNPALPMDFSTRLTIQEHILSHAEEIWFEMDQPFICDRTPIDMAAYLFAEIQGNTLSPLQEYRVMNYRDRCLLLTAKYFSHVVIVPPAIAIVEAEGKASCSRAYIEHIHALCIGLANDSGSEICVLYRDNVQLEGRVNSIEQWIS